MALEEVGCWQDEKGYKSKILIYVFNNNHELFVRGKLLTKKYVKGIWENYHNLNK